MNAKEKQRIDHIDSIRGIAALTVIFIHASDAFIQFPSVKEHGTLFYDLIFRFHIGMGGVMAFFAISGFVICPTLKGAKASGTRRFLISRLCRLFPLFWAAIFLYLITDYLVMGTPVDWGQVLGNLPMLYTAFDVEPVIGVFWTLEVEMVFYIVCLVLFLCGWLESPWKMFLVGVALMTIYTGLVNRPEVRDSLISATHNVWLDLPRHLAIMFWGGLFRMWYDDRQGTVTVGSYQIPVLVLVIALAALILLRPIIVVDKALYEGDGPLFSWAFAYILGIAMMVVGSLWIRIHQPFFVWLGTTSYSLYLLHPVVIIPMRKMVEMNPEVWGGMHISVYILAVCVVSIIVSSITYLVIEKPAINLGRAWIRRKKPPAPLPVENSAA